MKRMQTTANKFYTIRTNDVQEVTMTAKAAELELRSMLSRSEGLATNTDTSWKFKRLKRSLWDLLLLRPARWAITVSVTYTKEQGTDDEPDTKNTTVPNTTDPSGTDGTTA